MHEPLLDTQIDLPLFKGCVMDPYTLIITSLNGSTVIPLGTEAAHNWQEKYKERIKDPIIAQLRPTNPDGPWSLIQVVYPKETKVSFKIITQGRLFTKTGVTEELKLYHLGWDDGEKITYIVSHKNGTTSLCQEESK